MPEPTVLRADACERIEDDWGRLTWFAGRTLGNAEGLTLGRCEIEPGRSNPHHHHPNCEEVLVVLEGRIRHTAAEGEVEMGPGDVITCPPGFAHHATNVGDETAVLLVAFSSADRQVVGE